MSSNNITKRAKTFRKTRAQHGLEMAEDYTEMVAELIKDCGQARTCEIAQRLGVSHVTAVKTIQRLQRDGFLLTSPHRPVKLTDKGSRLAKTSLARHNLLLDFLIAIGVPKKTAEVDVEGIEHHVSNSTLKFIKIHLERIRE